MDKYQKALTFALHHEKGPEPLSHHSAKPLTQSLYPELQVFRHELTQKKQGLHDLPYSSRKKQVQHYKSVFIILGTVFLLLGTFACFKSLTWSYSFLFAGTSLIKSVLCTSCALLSSSAFVVGFTISAEGEATPAISRSAKTQLCKCFRRKQLKYGLRSFLNFGEKQRQAEGLKHYYQEALDQLHDHKEEATLLMDRISKSGSIDTLTKERLLNQALLDLRDKLRLVTMAFSNLKTTQLLLK